jgi:hypothetical protein
MRASKFLSALMILCLSISLCLGAEKKTSPKKNDQIPMEKSLIREDLLKTKEGDLGSPRRNIFSLQPASTSASLTADVPSRAVGVQGNPRGVGAPDQKEAPVVEIRLTYIGYINSREKIIGLVIYGGEALAVKEGEVIGEGIKVGKIAHKEIEIIGPDSTTRKYPLEGEK